MDQIDDERPLARTHRGERLVEEHDPGVGVHRAGDRDRLPLASRAWATAESIDWMRTPIPSMDSRDRFRMARLSSNRNGPKPTVSSRFRNMLWYTDIVGTRARSW